MLKNFVYVIFYRSNPISGQDFLGLNGLSLYHFRMYWPTHTKQVPNRLERSVVGHSLNLTHLLGDSMTAFVWWAWSLRTRIFFLGQVLGSIWHENNCFVNARYRVVNRLCADCRGLFWGRVWSSDDLCNRTSNGVTPEEDPTSLK